jgi:hypothetical protein
MAQPGDEDYIPRRKADLQEPRAITYPTWEYEGMNELKSEISESPNPHPSPGARRRKPPNP